MITKPLKEAPEQPKKEAVIAEFISKGAKAADAANKIIDEDNKPIQINVTIPGPMSRDIDKARKGKDDGYVKQKDTAKVAWILQACVEKLQRDLPEADRSK